MFAAMLMSIHAEKTNEQINPLSPLLTSNKPGKYPLKPAWVGVEKVTIHIGRYATKDSHNEQESNRSLRFDMLVISKGEKNSPFNKPRICESGGDTDVQGAAHGYRDSLPSDDELLKMRDEESMAKLYGLRSFSGWNNPGISLFRLVSSNKIETITVVFDRPKSGSPIESLLVRRGFFRQDR